MVAFPQVMFHHEWNRPLIYLGIPHGYVEHDVFQHHEKHSNKNSIKH